MTRTNTRRTVAMVATGVAVGVALFATAAFGPTRSGSLPSAAVLADGGVAAAGEPRLPVGASLDDMIASLQQRLEAVPTDQVSWATLGLAYVQQAKVTVDPTYYPKADGALARSLEIDAADNFLAYAGLSALASARHDFRAAETYARQGLDINDFSPILWGALSDAQLQLGQYDDAFDSVQRMVDLRPDATSLSRASYTWELRGDIDRARSLMQRALDDAPTAADRAFALVHLAGIDFDQGNPSAALDGYNQALAASPDDVAALAGKARAEAALGQIDTAIDHYDQVVARAPEPGYVVEYARLLESVGRTDDAAAQYAVFDATQALFAANGVEPDATATLADAERGDVDAALADAQRGIDSRPFLDMYDAQAWALHHAGRDDEALAAIDRALVLGTRNALFHYHAGMIAMALGDTDRALTELRTALDINPTFDPLSAPIAADALRHLEAP